MNLQWTYFYDVWASPCRMTYVQSFIFTFICWGHNFFLCAHLKFLQLTRMWCGNLVHIHRECAFQCSRKASCVPFLCISRHSWNKGCGKPISGWKCLKHAWRESFWVDSKKPKHADTHREEQESNRPPSVCGFCAPNTQSVQASHLPKDITHRARLHTATKFHTYVNSVGE